MDIVQASTAFCFNYVDYGQSTGLYVQAAVYDVSSGTAVFVQNVVMPSVAIGLYSGNFTGSSGKTYLVISVVYTDNTYATADPNRAPSARCFQVFGISVTYLAFFWPAYDQNASLNVAGSVYDCTSGTPTFVVTSAMAHVAYGVYFGHYAGTVEHTYEVLEAAYTDNTFATPDTLYSPGADAFACFAGAAVINEYISPLLIVTGQSLNATLEES